MVVPEGGFLPRCWDPGTEMQELQPGTAGILQIPITQTAPGSLEGESSRSYPGNVLGAPHPKAEQLQMGTDSLAGQGLCTETSQLLPTLWELGPAMGILCLPHRKQNICFRTGKPKASREQLFSAFVLLHPPRRSSQQTRSQLILHQEIVVTDPCVSGVQEKSSNAGLCFSTAGQGPAHHPSSPSQSQQQLPRSALGIPSAGNSIRLEQALPSRARRHTGSSAWAGNKAGRMGKGKAAFIPLPGVWRNPENLWATQINLGNFKVQAIILVPLVRLPCSFTNSLLNSCPGLPGAAAPALTINNTPPICSRKSSRWSSHHCENTATIKPGQKSEHDPGSSSGEWGFCSTQSWDHSQHTPGCSVGNPW